MSSRAPAVCDIPAEHAGPARLYPCGWRCTRHRPQPTNPTSGGQPR